MTPENSGSCEGQAVRLQDSDAIRALFEAHQRGSVEIDLTPAVKTLLSTLDKEDALTHPGYVIRCVIVDAMRMFVETHHREAAEIDLTPDMEILLSTSDEDMVWSIKSHGPMRTWLHVLGCRPKFDVKHFALR